MQFTIPYEVSPASRPRVTKYGIFYTKNYEEFRRLVGIWLDQWKQKNNLQPFDKDVPLKARFVFNMALPKSWSKRKRELCSGVPMISKRDLDNMVKAIQDVMQGRLFHDDCQIFYVVAEKYWEEEGSIEVYLNDKW